MKFSIRKQCFGRSRLGLLSFECMSSENNTKTNTSYSTPICLQYTINGSVPHIVHDLLDDLNDDNSPMLIPLPTTLLMNESLRQFNKTFDGLKSGIRDYVGLKRWRPTIVSIQDPLLEIKSGHNATDGIAVFCRGGKQAVNSSRLIDIMTNFKPDAYQSICDSDTPSNASNKRIYNSVDRSLYLMDECIDKHNDCPDLKDKNISILGTIQGGLHIRSRLKSAKESADKAVDGFVIDGFHLYGNQSHSQLDLNSVKPILAEIFEILPKDKPMIMFGVLTPFQIIQLIDSGIDVFDSSYATVMTEDGIALQEIIDNNILKVTNLSIDLKSKQFKEDFNPIDDNCRCYTCVNGFSRAYINHLLNASEMLAKVLLNFHNLETFYNFFRQIKDLLERDKFQQLLQNL
ncbi:queuine tRNA-ribosyltransferase accessory subunit 2-like [Oppia nitens]|uniref:queuine tRNA-ribosyltransferase accessory subunit 2-like n=1 Tax=Oppia nitens TaxID=1686743 RepID=UPI0023DA4413|nr:queuine tRNA-ribosyltransferase accessory subunit 2-like [Oppia nitens]